jgi:hypothetical protein
MLFIYPPWMESGWALLRQKLRDRNIIGPSTGIPTQV